MGELTISQLIKIILGMFVVVAVIIAIYFVFKDKIFSFFKNLPGESPRMFLALLK